MPKLKGLTFETSIIERYKRRETSVEEALIEMYLAGVSVRRVEDISEALWGTKDSPGTISNLNKRAYDHIEEWRNRKLTEEHPYIFVDTESWKNFFVWLKSRGLSGVKLITGDKAMGMVEAIGEVFPDAKYQRCTVHFYRNVFTVVPKQRVKEVARMLKAIHSQEDKAAALEKATAVAEKLRSMRLAKAAPKVEESIAETLTYMSFPMEHWTRIRTNNTLERLNK